MSDPRSDAERRLAEIAFKSAPERLRGFSAPPQPEREALRDTELLLHGPGRDKLRKWAHRALEAETQVEQLTRERENQDANLERMRRELVRVDGLARERGQAAEQAEQQRDELRRVLRQARRWGGPWWTSEQRDKIDAALSAHPKTGRLTLGESRETPPNDA